MSLYDVIKEKLDRLIDIMQTDGVQPCDLANNISLDSYKSISYKKANNQIIGELVFDDYNDNGKTDVTYRYFYNNKLRVLRIEEEFDGHITIKWDREIIETELINDIVNLLETHYTKKQIKLFINTLPNEIKNKIEKSIEIVA